MGAVRVPAQARFVPALPYLTARCPTGCESWLHPRAVESHLRPGRCRRKPWIDDLNDSALVPRPSVGVFVARLPSELVEPVAMALGKEGRYPRRDGFRYDVLQGIVIRSPIEGVRARRWLYVVMAGLDRFGPDAIDTALTSAGFNRLQRHLDLEHELVDCPTCGETVRRSLDLHRARSTRCRWRRAQEEVRSVWDSGWRDPFTVPEAPATWTALQAKAVWRHRTRTVTFPRWISVLVSPLAPGNEPSPKVEVDFPQPASDPRLSQLLSLPLEPTGAHERRRERRIDL